MEPPARPILFAAAPIPSTRIIRGTVVWQDGSPAADAIVTLKAGAPQTVPVDATGTFRLTLPYGAKFTLTATGQKTVNGRTTGGSAPSVLIGRNDRDRDVPLVLQERR